MTILAEKVISDIARGVGRPKRNTEQTPARFPPGTLARIDAVLLEGESRSDFLLIAAQHEIKKRRGSE